MTRVPADNEFILVKLQLRLRHIELVLQVFLLRFRGGSDSSRELGDFVLIFLKRRLLLAFFIGQFLESWRKSRRTLLRGAKGNVVFSSVIVVDVTAPQHVARILEDRAGPIARLTPAITRTPLDAATLDADPEYLPELARIVAAAVAREQQP